MNVGPIPTSRSFAWPAETGPEETRQGPGPASTSGGSESGHPRSARRRRAQLDNPIFLKEPDIRLTLLTLTLLSATTLSGLAFGNDPPDRSPELQVLDRFVGSWDMKLTIQPTGGEETAVDGVSHRSWSLGGNFVRFEDPNNLERPESNEAQMLLTYDSNRKNYPGVLMDGANRVELTGTWDAKTTTMHWAGKSPDGGTSTGYHRFIGKDRAEASTRVNDADGNVVLRISWVQTRRKVAAIGTEATAKSAVDKTRQKELK